MTTDELIAAISAKGLVVNSYLQPQSGVWQVSTQTPEGWLKRQFVNLGYGKTLHEALLDCFSNCKNEKEPTSIKDLL